MLPIMWPLLILNLIFPNAFNDDFMSPQMFIGLIVTIVIDLIVYTALAYTVIRWRNKTRLD